MEKYLERGVSAAKEEVYKAIEGLQQGLYPKAFCKIYPDWLCGDNQYVTAMSSDGCGTKSILAYLYKQETGDASVWQGIATDALVMNIDDLLCVGASGPFLFNSIINRNKNIITSDDLKELIQGSAAFCSMMAEYGISIHYMGGETADLGDVVRTVTVDATLAARLHKNQLILTENIRPGLVIVGLASYGQAIYEKQYNSGISSNGLTSARHDLLSKLYAEKFPETYDPGLSPDVVYCGKYRLTDPLPDTPLTIGQALLSPTRTFAPLVKQLLQQLPGKIAALINCTGGGQTKVL
ncbi:MAG: AIR synthase related protein, partial [Chitinophagales bacterium]|nr:AIR synthase related protein [Chitinophagales bacterium]